MRVALLTPVLALRDAIGADVAEMAAALRAAGQDVRLYADRIEESDEPVHSVAGLPEWLQAPDDCLIYHHSTAWPAAEPLLRRLQCRRYVRYHNVTPPEYFFGVSMDHVRACAAGRVELAALATILGLSWLADSPYNRDELLDLGVTASRIEVLPPLHRVESLIGAASDPELIDRFTGGGAVLLMVGRLAPNKGHLELLDAFACYVRHYEPDARLLIVGKQDMRLARYLRQVHVRAESLGIAGQVHFLEDVDQAALKACYQIADALLYLSAHEGFGVPLVEAMALSLPIVARAAAATPLTVAEAGVLWPSVEPGLYAASIARLRRDADLRERLVEAGRRRYRSHFHSEVLVRKLCAVLGVSSGVV